MKLITGIRIMFMGVILAGGFTSAHAVQKGTFSVKSVGSAQETSVETKTGLKAAPGKAKVQGPDATKMTPKNASPAKEKQQIMPALQKGLQVKKQPQKLTLPERCNGKIVTILGTSGVDFLNGTPGPDVMHGLGGDDIIRGFGGNDTICGGDGNDTLYGGDGNNALDGGSGIDLCINGPSGPGVLIAPKNCENQQGTGVKGTKQGKGEQTGFAKLKKKGGFLPKSAAEKAIPGGPAKMIPKSSQTGKGVKSAKSGGLDLVVSEAENKSGDAPNALLAVNCMGLTCEFDGSASVGSIKQYCFYFGDDNPIYSCGAQKKSHTYAAPGTYFVKLTVSNYDDQEDSYQKQLTVHAVSQFLTKEMMDHAAVNPIAYFTSDCVFYTCTFNAGASSSGTPITSYSWDFGDNTTGSGVGITHTFKAGKYKVSLQVRNTANLSDSTFKVVRVGLSPTASFTINCTALLTCSFDASASTDDDGSIVQYTWFFVGVLAPHLMGSGVSANHTYAAPGTYNVKLMVEDNHGLHDEQTKTISIP